MTRLASPVLSLTIGMICVLSVIGCGRGPKTTSLNAMEEPAQPVTPHVVSNTDPAGNVTAREAVLTQRVSFPFNAADLSPEAKAALAAKVAVLRESPGLRLRVEGHADEQGSDAYNQALGMRRALAAKRYLVQKGVDAQRLYVISYGEKRPLAQGHSEVAWSANRRVDFAILTAPIRTGR